MDSDYSADPPSPSEEAASMQSEAGMYSGNCNSSKSYPLPNKLSRWEAQWIISQMERNFLSQPIGKISKRTINWEQFLCYQSGGTRRYSIATYKEIYGILRRKAFHSMNVASEIRLIMDYLRKCNTIFVISAASPMITDGNSLYFHNNVVPRLLKRQPGLEPRLARDIGTKEFSALPNAEQQVWIERADAINQTCSDKFVGILSHQKLEFLDDMDIMDLLHFAADHNIVIDPIVTGFDRYFAFRHDHYAIKYPGDEGKIRSKLFQKYHRMSEENRIEWEKPSEEDVVALRNKIRETLHGIMNDPGSVKVKSSFPKIKLDRLVNKYVKSETLEEKLARMNLHLPRKPAKTVFKMFHEDFIKNPHSKLPPDAKPCELIQASSSAWQNLSEVECSEFVRQWTKNIAEYHFQINELIDQIVDPSLIVEIKEVASAVPSIKSARKRKIAAMAYQRRAKRQRLNDVSTATNGQLAR